MSKSIASIVKKAIAKKKCQKHSASLTHYMPSSKKSKLVCQQCIQTVLNEKRMDKSKKLPLDIKKYYCLDNLLQNPILLMMQVQKNQPLDDSLDRSLSKLSQTIDRDIGNAEFRIQPKHLQLIMSSHYLINSDYSILEKFLDQLKEKVNSYCQRILKVYKDTKSRDQMHKSNVAIEKMNRLSKEYKQQFQQMLSDNFIQGSPEQLILIFQKYRTTNLNPTQKVIQFAQEFQQMVKEQYLINWDIVQKLYQKVSNPQIWKTSNFFFLPNQNRSSKANPIILAEQISKLNSSSYFRYDRINSKIQLFESQNKNQSDEIEQSPTLKKVSQLALIQYGQTKSEQFDFFQQISNYRIVGVSYNRICVFKYSCNCLKLQLSQTITGCTQVLDFGQNCLIILARNKVIRIWLNAKDQSVQNQVLNIQVQSIRKVNDLTLQMIQQNGKKGFFHSLCSIKY